MADSTKVLMYNTKKWSLLTNMNALAIGLGIFILFITSLANNDLVLSLLGTTSGIALFFVGSKSIKKRYPKVPFYLAIFSFITFSVLLFKDLTFPNSVEEVKSLIASLIFVFPLALLVHYHKPKKTPKKRKKWSWTEGKVDTYAEHMELRYGSVESGGWDEWRPVAYISAPQDQVFYVQFLLHSSDEQEKLALEAAKRELNFYLVDKEEPDPWEYAQYHCGTMADVYSHIHWSFFPNKNTSKITMNR